MKRLLCITLGLTSVFSLFGMKPSEVKQKKDEIRQEMFNDREKVFLSNAISRWTAHSNITDNDLYDAFKTIEDEGINSLLNDQEAFKYANQILGTMKKDNRYHEAQELLTQTLTPETTLIYKKKIMILGLKILITYAGINPPEEIMPTLKSNGIVSNEQNFLQVNYNFEPNKFSQLKGALLALSLELSKIEPESEKGK